jgi:hypothetical protein
MATAYDRTDRNEFTPQELLDAEFDLQAQRREAEESERVTGPRYPEIEVELIGRDGNAFAILGAVRTALRRGGVAPEEINEFMAEAMSGDYDHLLATVMEWVEVF